MGEAVMRYQMIPLYNPKAILEAWPIITAGIERVVEFSGGDDDATLVLNRLLSGELLLWVIFEETRYAGFFTTHFQVFGTNPPTKALWLDHAYKIQECEANLFEHLFGDLTAFARKHDCGSVRFSSRRDKAFERRLKTLGFEPTHTEFRKDVSHGW